MLHMVNPEYCMKICEEFSTLTLSTKQCYEHSQLNADDCKHYKHMKTSYCSN